MLIQKIMIVKFLRVFGSSLMSIILPIFLLSEGYNAIFIGIIVSLMIISNIPFNIVLTLVIKRLGRRLMLVLLSSLMIISALLFLWDFNAIVIISPWHHSNDDIAVCRVKYRAAGIPHAGPAFTLHFARVVGSMDPETARIGAI